MWYTGHWTSTVRVGISHAVAGRVFILEGIWKIVSSLSYRSASGWVWVLGSGVLSLLLGLLIWNQWPVSGMWAVGVLVGVDLLSTGISMVVLSSRAT